MSAGVYIQKDAQGRILYIGQSCNSYGRTSNHRSSAPWGEEIAETVVIPFEFQRNRSSIERELIRNLKPMHNKIFKNLPTNEELKNLNFVFTPHWFYDGVRDHFQARSEGAVASLLGVTTNHILTVRLGLTNVSTQEKVFVSAELGITPYQLPKFFARRRNGSA